MRPPLSWIFPGASLIADLLWLTAFFGLLIIPLINNSVNSFTIFLAFSEIAIYCFLASYFINKFKQFNGVGYYWSKFTLFRFFIKNIESKYPVKPSANNYKYHVQGSLFAGIVFLIFAVVILFFPFAS